LVLKRTISPYILLIMNILKMKEILIKSKPHLINIEDFGPYQGERIII